MLGAFFALLSAVAFSLNAVLIRRGVVLVTPAQATLITVVMGVPMFAVVALVTGQLLRWDELPAESYAYLAGGGVINFVAGRLFNYKAIEAIGAARAAPFQALTLPYSVLIAFLFLDEGVTWFMGAGIALVMTGPLLMVERGRHTPPRPFPLSGREHGTGRSLEEGGQRVSSQPVSSLEAETEQPALGDTAPAFELRQAEGYAAALLAAVAYGTSPILFRAALEDATDMSVFSGLVSYIAAAAVLVAAAFLPGRAGELRVLEPATLRALSGASASVVLAQMLRFLGLSLAPVVTVTALERMNSVFTLVLSWKVNRSLELITVRVVIGVAVSALGALILVVAL